MMQFTPISQLLPTEEPCKIRVRIACLWAFQKPERPGVITDLEMILVDEQGTRIQASVNQGLLQKYQKQFEEGGCRVIMNFKLLPNQGSFRGAAHPYKISFLFTTHVKASDDIPNLQYRFHFHPFTELGPESHDTTIFFDVIGEIIGISEIEDVKIGSRSEKMLRIQLRDLGENIVDCTLWSKFAQEAHSYVKSNDSPIVMIVSLMKTKLFNGKTTVQSTPFASKLFFSSDMEEIKTFNEGLGHSSDMVALSQLTSSSTSSLMSNDAFPVNSYKIIAEILDETEEMLCVTLATIVSFYTEEPWFYIGCNTCFRKATPYFNPITEQVEHDKHSCGHCKNEITPTSLRYMVKVRVTDQTETAFDREVIDLVHKPAYEMRLNQIQANREAEFPQQLLNLEGIYVLLKLKVKISDRGFHNSSYQVSKLSVARSDIQKFRGFAEEKDAILNQLPLAITLPSDQSDAKAIHEAKVDHNPSTISTSSDLSGAISNQVGNSSSESSDKDVFTDRNTPVQKRPLTELVEDEVAEHSSTKRVTPQSVNKPKKVFVKKEKKN